MSSLCRVYANKMKQSSVKHNKEPRMDLKVFYLSSIKNRFNSYTINSC